ncbi:MAG TPA: serine hydrolase domain-containing protein [Vicinamibacterales bacterium]|jgi:CubicO group peptidase (beta-lactamase class C family)
MMRARQVAVSGLMAVAAAASLWAQASAPAKTASATNGHPTNGGLAPDRVARIDTMLQSYVDRELITGAVALVLRDGSPVYQKAVGWADKDARRQMRMDTMFRIASQTKAITSVAALRLVEEGKLSLSDQVGKYIPSFSKTTVAVRNESGTSIVPAKRPITIRDLLTHTAGISYGVEPQIANQYGAKGLGPSAGAGWYFADKREPICDVMERLGTLPFIAQPGDAWVYGYNTDVLGCVIERVSGQHLDEVIATRVTKPLGMTDTQFFLPVAQRDRLAAVYANGENGRAVRAPDGPLGQGSYVDGPRQTFAGGAGLVSTARDYGRFLEMIRGDGALEGVRILSPHTVALMRTNQVGALHSTNGLGFGLGFETTDRYGANGMDDVGSYGWGGAYGTVYRVNPQARLVIVLMIQLLPNTTDIREKFPTMVYQALMETPRLD